jgi:uncharacterized GH25 family protein
MNLNSRLLCALILLLTLLPAAAHDYWLRPDDGGARLVYGHAKESEPYQQSVLKKLTAIGKDGELQGRPEFQNGTFFLKLPGALTYLAKVDDGPWTKTTKGWKRGSRSQHQGAIRATQEFFYAKLVQSGKDKAYGLPLEIVLDPDSPDKVVRGKVLFKGKPAKNVPIEVEHKTIARTDTQGRFVLEGRAEKPLILRAAYKEKLSGHPEIDSASHVFTLTLRR